MRIRGFRRAGHLPTLVAAFVHFDVSFAVWVLLGALGAYISRDLSLSPAQKGLVVAVPALGGACFRVLVGTLADRFPRKRIGLATLSLTLVPLGWGYLAGGTFPQVLGIGLLLGIAGTSFVAALPLASGWYPPAYQGLALGLVGSGNSGTLVAALTAPRLAEHVGWHGVFGLAVLPVVATLGFFAALAKEPPGEPSQASVLSLLEEPDARWLSGFYMVTFGGFLGLAGYLPIFFVDRFGIPAVTAASYAAACASAGSLLRPIGGTLADRFGGTSVLTAVLLSAAVMAGALATLPGLGLTAILLFGILGALGLGNGAVFQLVPQRFPARMGAMTGLAGAVGGLGGFLLPFAFGSLHQATGTFRAGFAMIALATLATGTAVTWRQRVWRVAWDIETAV